MVKLYHLLELQVYLHIVNPLIYRGVVIFEKSQKKGVRFSCKNGSQFMQWGWGFCRKIFWIKSHPGVAYKSSFYKNAHNIAFQSSRNEEITLPHEFIFVFVWYFLGGDVVEQSCQKQGGQKRIKGGMAIQGGLSIEVRVQTYT